VTTSGRSGAGAHGALAGWRVPRRRAARRHHPALLLGQHPAGAHHCPELHPFLRLYHHRKRHQPATARGADGPARRNQRRAGTPGRRAGRHARYPEAELLPLLRRLGIGFIPYSLLGHGFLTGQIRTPGDIPGDDWRTTNPRFTGDNFQRNLAIVDEVRPSPPRPEPRPRRSPWPGCSPRATTSPRSPAPAASPARDRVHAGRVP
jgi:Aldo/keto reductase family